MAMDSMWVPKHWRRFIQRLKISIFAVSGLGWIMEEIEAALSVIYGGSLSFFYLFSLFLLTSCYGGKIPLLWQMFISLRMPVTVIGLALGHILPIFILEWTLLGFVLFYPLLFVYNKWEQD